MSAEPEPRGTLELALAHAARLLERQPAAAVEQAHEILKVIPNQPQALWLLATAWRGIGDQLTAGPVAVGVVEQLDRHLEAVDQAATDRHEAALVAEDADVAAVVSCPLDAWVVLEVVPLRE